MKKVSVKILKYKLPIEFVVKLLQLFELEGSREVGFVFSRTQNGLPITRFNFYVEDISEEKLREIEKKLIELATEYNMKPNVVRKIEVSEDRTNSQAS